MYAELGARLACMLRKCNEHRGTTEANLTLFCCPFLCS